MKTVKYTKKFSGESPAICKHEWRLLGKRMEKYFLLPVNEIPILKNQLVMCDKCGWSTTAVKCEVIGNKPWNYIKEYDNEPQWYDIIVDVLVYKELPPTKLMDYTIESVELNWWDKLKKWFKSEVIVRKVTHRDVMKRISKL